MSRLITLCTLLVIGLPAAAQQSVYVSNGVFMKDSTIAEVVDVWDRYLSARPDSAIAFWNKAESERYQDVDLAPQYFGTPIHRLIGSYKPTVTSVTYGRGFYKVCTSYMQQIDSGYCDLLATISVYLRKDPDGWHLYNSLPIATSDWSRETFGSIGFIHPSDVPLNRLKAFELAAFADSLREMFGVPRTAVDYYFADDNIRLMRSLGFEFYMGEGNRPAANGKAYATNKIVFGADSSARDGGAIPSLFRHELSHAYLLAHYPEMNGFVSEGIATFFGGSRLHSLGMLVRRADTLLAGRPSQKIDSLMTDPWAPDLDAYVGIHYLIGGMLVKEVYERSGMAGMKRLLSYKNSPNDTFRLIKSELGVDREDIDTYFRRKIRDYASSRE